MPSPSTRESSGIPPDPVTNDLAMASPCALRVLENLGVDYWFGWNRRLEDACADAAVSVDRVIEAIEREQASPNENPRIWSERSLCELMARLGAHWERRVSGVLGPIREHADQLLEDESMGDAVHEAVTLGLELSARMRDHIRKSQLIAYPYIRRLENAVLKRAPFAVPEFGTLSIPLSHLSREHEELCLRISGVRCLSDVIAANAEPSRGIEIWCDLLRTLGFELHQHILFEHNFLFPRALAMESSTDHPGASDPLSDRSS